MKDEVQVRREFSDYFLELQDEAARACSVVSKAHEWRLFVDRLASEGLVPPSASRWTCPRDLEAALRR